MPSTDFDRIDLQILKELQSEARLTNAELATRVNLSASPCLTRVRALEESGVISRYVALLNPQAVGLPVSVFIQVTLERQIERSLEEFEAKVNRYPEIMECYLMTGDADYLLRVVVPDVQAFRMLVNELTRIPGVANIHSSLAPKQAKYATALPLDAKEQSSSPPRATPRRKATHKLSNGRTARAQRRN